MGYGKGLNKKAMDLKGLVGMNDMGLVKIRIGAGSQGA
jgi:hypothetical protein